MTTIFTGFLLLISSSDCYMLFESGTFQISDPRTELAGKQILTTDQG